MQVLVSALLLPLSALALSGCDVADGALLTSEAGSSGGRPDLLVLGDSYSGAPAWRQAFEAQLPGVNIAYDSVGGSSLAEQFDRLAERPEYEGVPLVILDGGLTDKRPADEVRRIVELQAPECDQWYYVEPVRRVVNNPKNAKIRAERHAEQMAQMETEFSGHLIGIMDTLLENGNGSTSDQSDISNGWVPGSLRGDQVHLNAQGYAILAKLMSDHMKAADFGADCPADGAKDTVS